MEIKFKNIGKKYGFFEVLRDINFIFEEGKFYGFFGFNGVGKIILFNFLI